MKLTRKQDPYGAEKIWLEANGISNPTEETLVHLRRRNRIALSLFTLVVVAALIAYFLLVR